MLVCFFFTRSTKYLIAISTLVLHLSLYNIHAFDWKILGSIDRSLVEEIGSNTSRSRGYGDSNNTSTLVEIKMENLSFFQLLSCPDGKVGMGADCACPEGMSCQYSTLRTYLPPLSVLKASFIANSPSDSLFSDLFSRYITEMARIETHRGFPLDRECNQRVVDAENLCKSSFGKFLRYNAMVEYTRFHRDTFNRELGPSNSSASLYNIDYPEEFKWTRKVPRCSRSSADKDERGWNCAFLPLSSPNPCHGCMARTGSTDSQLEKMFQHIARLRSTHRNNAVQIPIFGKILQLLSRPSRSNQMFFLSNLVNVYDRYNRTARAVAMDILEGNDDRKEGEQGLIVSMHVRHGDACDFFIDHAVEKLAEHTRSATDWKRSCFTLPVYMEKLNQLRDLYGVSRVYLATDSEAMIKLTKEIKDINWVYLNISREVFSGKHGWINLRSDERNEEILFSSTADLLLLSRGDIFLGTLSSHYSKLAYFVMAGAKMRVPPFLSLDYPMSCDTVDICSDEAIISREQTIEGIINRSPNCQRNGVHKSLSGWAPSSGPFSDPCGIYLSHHEGMH